MKNASESKFIAFLDLQKKRWLKTYIRQINEHLIEEKKVENLRIYTDQVFTYQQEAKNTLGEIAYGIKTILSIRRFTLQKTRLLLVNASVCSTN